MLGQDCTVTPSGDSVNASCRSRCGGRAPARTYDGTTHAAYTIIRPGVVLSSYAQPFASVRPALHRAP
eukprot:4525482-Prymnesium_polylepis.1